MSDEKAYICDVCGETFKTSQALASHKLYKHGLKPGKSPIEQDRVSINLESPDFKDLFILDSDEFTSVKRIPTKVELEPEILILYTYAVSQGFKGSLHDFINACVINFMKREAGVVVALIPNGGGSNGEACRCRSEPEQSN